MTFTEFFRAVWGHDPFPWQESLAERALQGDWPRSIGLPTAAGKTALIDIAVYALAMGAARAARRVFFVVDRRVIVDEAVDRAERLREALQQAPAGSELGKLAQSLKALGGTEPLITAVLRGGIPKDGSWAESPLQPAVICSTVDQVGSSLLFRPYGASEYSRPIRAGLAAYDSLIILDEAHTSQPFQETLGWIARYRDWVEQPLNGPLTIVEMSATPRGESFRETEKDLRNELLRRRWIAGKRTKLVMVEAAEGEEASRGGFTALVEGLVREARRMRDERGAGVIGVIANRVMTARRVHDALRGPDGSEAILLTGRTRAYDRDRIWNRYRAEIGLGHAERRDKPLFVVATQCIEVGANLEFDALVTEIASIDALEQRFGRLDRDGRFAAALGTTHAAIVAQSDQTAKKYEDAIYGAALSGTWSWLKDHVTKEVRTEVVPPEEGKKKARAKKIKEEFVEMGVLALRGALQNTAERGALAMPASSTPVMMPAHMDLLCQTSPEPAVSPDVSVFLHGPETGPADVQVVWRADLEREDLAANPDTATSIVAICPPGAAETMSLPVWTVRNWLEEQEPADVADLEGLKAERTSTRGRGRPALQWQGVDDSRVLDTADQIRPGMLIVVPASYGGCDEWGWNPGCTEAVQDVGDPVKLRLGRPMLRLHSRLAAQWGYGELAESLRTAEQKAEVKSRIEAAGALGEDWVPETLSELAKCPASRLRLIGDSVNETLAAIAGTSGFDQNDSRSSYGTEIRLDKHLSNCKLLAEDFARELPELLRNTVMYAAALHDVGKADPRFQAWLRGGNPVSPGELIAKSKRSGQNRAAIDRARRMSGYPKGGRHELTSIALVQEYRGAFKDVDFDLLLHLIGSHHGRCRPFAPVVPDDEPVEVRYGEWRTMSNHGLERAGSGICERFWKLTRRYGWYGLAYLESIVRLADQRESEAEQNRMDERAANA
jgi:CRISPR-associated endonuclease/helicase Cas3